MRRICRISPDPVLPRPLKRPLAEEDELLRRGRNPHHVPEVGGHVQEGGFADHRALRRQVLQRSGGADEPGGCTERKGEEADIPPGHEVRQLFVGLHPHPVDVPAEGEASRIDPHHRAQHDDLPVGAIVRHRRQGGGSYQVQSLIDQPEVAQPGPGDGGLARRVFPTLPGSEVLPDPRGRGGGGGRRGAGKAVYIRIPGPSSPGTGSAPPVRTRFALSRRASSRAGNSSGAPLKAENSLHAVVQDSQRLQLVDEGKGPSACRTRPPTPGSSGRGSGP